MGNKNIYKEYLVPFNEFDLGIVERYSLGWSQLTQLRKFLSSAIISSDFLYNIQSEYIISVRAYPFWMNKFFDGIGEYENFGIGRFKASEVNCKGRKITQQKPPVLIGEYDVPRKYNNFMDFAPYTKITAYLPYISFVDLPVNEIMGKHIYFYAQVDFNSGLLTIWLECENVMIESWESPIGVEISLNHTNGTEWARNMYLWGIKAVTGMGGLSVGATENPVRANTKAITTGGDIATGFIGANQHHVYKGGYSSGINKLYNPTSIYLIFQREVPNETNVETNTGDNTYASIYGLPLKQVKCLSTLRGMTVINNLHLHNLTTAYESEKSEIEQLLRSGVIF